MPSVFITCAVTGGGDTVSKSPHVPVTPEQIANSAIEAARAGAAVVHCHVRDLDTGAQSRDLDLYKELTDRIRASDTDVVLNLTGGTGADLTLGGVEHPLPLSDEVAPITLLVGRAEGRPKRAVAVMQDLLLGWASGPRARDLIVARNS